MYPSMRYCSAAHVVLNLSTAARSIKLGEEDLTDDGEELVRGKMEIRGNTLLRITVS